MDSRELRAVIGIVVAALGLLRAVRELQAARKERQSGGS